MRGLNFSFFKISISLFVLKYIATINLVHLKMIHVCVCEKQHEGRGMTVSLFTKLVTNSLWRWKKVFLQYYLELTYYICFWLSILSMPSCTCICCLLRIGIFVHSLSRSREFIPTTKSYIVGQCTFTVLFFTIYI